MDGALEKVEVMRIPESAVKRWEGLMQKDSVDYDLENLPRFSCVFCQTAKFNDGILVDLKVCTSDDNGDVWSEAVAYDEHGHEVWVSPVSEGHKVQAHSHSGGRLERRRVRAP